jgi:hypothetical protein
VPHASYMQFFSSSVSVFYRFPKRERKTKYISNMILLSGFQSRPFIFQINECGNLYSEAHTLSKCLLCNFPCFIVLRENLIQTVICSLNANNTTRLTTHRVRNYFLCMSLNIHYVDKYFKHKLHILTIYIFYTIR